MQQEVTDSSIPIGSHGSGGPWFCQAFCTQHITSPSLCPASTTGLTHQPACNEAPADRKMSAGAWAGPAPRSTAGSLLQSQPPECSEQVVVGGKWCASASLPPPPSLVMAFPTTNLCLFCFSHLCFLNAVMATGKQGAVREHCNTPPRQSLFKGRFLTLNSQHPTWGRGGGRAINFELFP